MENNRLLIFCKYPEPGKVKTRLAKDIGNEEAAKVYKNFVETILKNTQSDQYQQTIFFDPVDKEDEITGWLESGSLLFAQKGNDLGEKLQNAFLESFNAGAQKVIVIGTDSPFINKQIIISAFDALHENDCVIGPAKDGGYYLLGLKKFYPFLFKGIAWSTDKVLSQSLQKIEGHKLNVFLLSEGLDVDTYEDLILFQKEKE